MQCLRPPRVCLLFATALLALPLAPAALASDETAAATAATAAEGSSDLLTQAQALAESDPAAVVQLLESTWQTASVSQREALALQLIEALYRLDRHTEVLALFASLDAPLAAPEDEQRLLAATLLAATALRNAAAADALMPRLEQLAERPLEPAKMAGLWEKAAGLQVQLGRFPLGEQLSLRGVATMGEGPSPVLFDLHRVRGVALVQQGRTAEAIESMLAAEQAAEAAGVAPGPAFLMNFGGMFIYAGEPARAVDYLQRAEQLALQDPDLGRHLPAIYNNLGNGEHGRGDLAAAQRYFEQSVEQAKARGSSPANGLNNLASVLRTRGRLDEALTAFEQVLELYRGGADRVGAAVALKNIGETLIALGQRQRAMDYLEQAHAIQRELDNRPKRLELLPVMVDNLEALGRHEEALSRLREFKAVSDEFNNADAKERIAKLQGAIDLAERDRELAAAEVERVQQEAAIIELRAVEQRQRWLTWALGAGVLGLSVVAALLVRAVRFRARANRELAASNREIEAQRRNLQKLNVLVRKQSLRDELTQLPNRRFLNEYMQDWTGRRVSSDATGMLVLIIDIDNFKQLNDRHGHLIGDQALVHLANLLREIQRASDVLVRWGGEEFVWLCPEVGVEAAEALCQRIRTQLHARPLQVGETRVPMSASIGYAALPLWPQRSADWTLSLRVADAALYCAKVEGKDRCVGFVGALLPPADPAEGVVIESLIAAGQLRRVDGGQRTDAEPHEEPIKHA